MSIALTAAATAVTSALLAGAASPAGAVTPLNGEQTKKPSQVLHDASAALAAARTVHIHGIEGTGAKRLSLNLYYASGRGSAGTLTDNGGSTQFVEIGPDFYVRGSQIHTTNPSIPATTWVHIKPGNAIASFTSLKGLASQALKPTGRLGTVVGRGTVGRVAAVVLTDTADGSKLLISNVGSPVPLAITGKSGSIRFDQYNRPVVLHRPRTSITPPTK